MSTYACMRFGAALCFALAVSNMVRAHASPVCCQNHHCKSRRPDEHYEVKP